MRLENIMNLSYNEYVVYLKAKYGKVQNNYFIKSKTGSYFTDKSNTRTNDGLMIHHVLENKYVYLSNNKYITSIIEKHPETQYPENLVYCNYLEHLILHIKITEELTSQTTTCGWGGIFSIMKHINSAYDMYYMKADTNYECIAENGAFRVNCTKAIINNLNDYLYIVDYILDNIYEKIIDCTDGQVKMYDLWKTYDDEFLIVKSRIMNHHNYDNLRLINQTRLVSSKYKSLNDVYKQLNGGK